MEPVKILHLTACCNQRSTQQHPAVRHTRRTHLAEDGLGAGLADEQICPARHHHTQEVGGLSHLQHALLVLQVGPVLGQAIPPPEAALGSLVDVRVGQAAAGEAELVGIGIVTGVTVLLKLVKLILTEH
jgi:hypothetical protein